MQAIFPARFYATDRGNWAQSPDLAKSVWMRIKPKDLTWYATDLEILDPNRIQIFAYEMKDTFYGGIGRKIYDTEVTEFTPEEKDMLDRMVLKLYTNAASEVLDELEDAKRMKKILAVRKKLFGV